jgi:hypothetical protein
MVTENKFMQLWRLAVARATGAVRGEAGMSTAEYATVDLVIPWAHLSYHL